MLSLADSPARGVHHAKDLERNAPTIVSARRVSSRVPGLMGGSCHTPDQLTRLRGGSRSSATRTPLASGCNVRTDKLKRGLFDGGAEQARLKVITCCEVGVSNPSLI